MERWVTPPPGGGDAGYMHPPGVEPEGEEHIETARIAHTEDGARHAHRGRLSLDSPVAPGWVPPGQPQHQLDRSRGHSRPARATLLGIRPPTTDQCPKAG